MISRTTGFIKNNKELFLFLLIYSVFNLLLINKFFPITEGWFQDYARYMMAGQVPYRDFYVPIPPGFLYLNELLRYFFSDVFLYYRIFGLIERLVLVTIIFFIFKRLYSGKTLLISLFTGAVIYIANVQDLFYGYYQTSFFFAVLVLYSAIKMYECYDSQKVYLWSILFGVCSAVSFLFKQTIGGLLPVILCNAFIFLTVKYDWRKTIKCCVIFLFSAIAVMSVVALLFYQSGALIPCIEQIFLGAKSKGNLTGVFFNFIPRMFNKESLKIFIAGPFLLLCYYIYSRTYNSTYKKICLIFIILVEFEILYFDFIRYFNFYENFRGIMYVFCLNILFVLSYLFITDKEEKLSCFLFTGFILIGLITISNSSIKIINFMDVRDSRQSFIYLLFFINCAWIIFYTYQLLHIVFQYKKAITFLILCASLGIMYAHGLSAQLEDHGTFLIVMLLLCQVLSIDIDLEMNCLIKPGVVSFCVLTIMCIFVQRCNLPYHWWGVNALQPIRESKFHYADPNLKGIKGNKKSVNDLNTLYELINRMKNDGDTMYTFPHINYFNVMSKLDSPTFAKVHYFDVCPDYIIDKDLELLKLHPPKFVLIQNFEESAWIVHEKFFRNGNRSSQRKVIDYYRQQIIQNNYRVIGEFKVDNSDGITLMVRNY